MSRGDEKEDEMIKKVEEMREGEVRMKFSE